MSTMKKGRAKAKTPTRVRKSRATKTQPERGGREPKLLGIPLAELDLNIDRELKLRGCDLQIFRQEYPITLPFDVHRESANLPTTIHTRVDRESYLWDDRECRVAEEALRRGFVLSVWVRPDHIAQASLIIAQNLTCRIAGRFEPHGNRLALWSAEDERLPDVDGLRTVIKQVAEVRSE